jgi:hypothetical protein
VIYVVALERVPYRVMQDFIDAMSEASSYYKKTMPNVWLVDTTHSAERLGTILKKHISKSDSLLIIRVVGEYDGWLTEETWKWLRISKNNRDFD